ncbi:hypothetical protein FKP32DRAFT_1592053 [Trametes sanguinea]|nr:hypothetical protein FKP32DRAFT_1592053 [Trametes sanguinea]
MAPTATLLSSDLQPSVSHPSSALKMSGPPTDFPLVPSSASSSRPQEVLDAPARTQFAFDPIEDALEAFARGEFLVVMDDESRENEGDLIIAASAVSTQKMAWMIKHTRYAYQSCPCPFRLLGDGSGVRARIPLFPRRDYRTDAPCMCFTLSGFSVHSTASGWDITGLCEANSVDRRGANSRSRQVISPGRLRGSVGITCTHHCAACKTQQVTASPNTCSARCKTAVRRTIARKRRTQSKRISHAQRAPAFLPGILPSARQPR